MRVFDGVAHGYLPLGMIGTAVTRDQILNSSWPYVVPQNPNAIPPARESYREAYPERNVPPRRRRRKCAVACVRAWVTCWLLEEPDNRKLVLY